MVMKLIQTIEECCPVAYQDAPMGRKDAERTAAAFKVLSDPVRLRMLSVIASCEDSESCVCDLAGPLGVTQPTVSHHLKVLHDAGFLDRRKEGTWVYYRIVPEALETLRAALSSPPRKQARR